MVADSEVTFRLQGIPLTFMKEDVERILSTALTLSQQCLSVELVSLSPNPLRFDEQVGTLSFTKIPDELRERKEKSIQLKAGDDNKPRRLVLDNHFRGFTPLHSAPDAECIFDVVAISGLHGHAFGSFKQKGGAYMWLRDSLPYDLDKSGKARIFLYGYETRGAHFQTLDDLAKTFRGDLRVLREDSQPPRPLVIIGHSLGGLIVKSALMDMRKSKDTFDRASFESIRGLLFFGVPSQGMKIESIIPLVGESARRSLIDSLDDVNSSVLRRQLEEFTERMDALRGGQLESIYYYETALSPTAKQVRPGEWKMEGPLDVLVTPNSATLPGYASVPMNRPHSDLVKFTGPNDAEYEKVRSSLRKISKSIASVIKVEKRSVRSNMVGCIIGRGGQKIANIRSSSAARITIATLPHDQDGRYRMITIMGSVDSIKKSFAIIDKELADERIRKSRN